MTQNDAMETRVRRRIKSLRLERGLSLNVLATQCFLSTSTLSRIETGHRRIALDQLVPIARALGTTIDQLLEPEDDEDIVIRPQGESRDGRTVWLLSREQAMQGISVAKMRIEASESTHEHQELRVHSGREWFTVLSGTVCLRLGERTIYVPAGHAAEFSTTVPHAILPHEGPVEILTIFDRDGERSHLGYAGVPVSEDAGSRSAK